MQLKFFLIADERGKKKKRPFVLRRDASFSQQTILARRRNSPAVKGGRQLHFPSDNA